MEKSPLNNKDTFPTDDVLQNVLSDAFPVFIKLMEILKSGKYLLNPEWRYYKDGNAWLCKITQKKKTVAWLSVWYDHFKLAFYFTEKSGSGINDLDIDVLLKEFYLNHQPIGKLKPLIIEIKYESQLSDIYKIIDYKIKQT